MSEIFDLRDATALLAASRAARNALATGELVVLPTDTVYGLAADAFTPEAVAKLLEAKGRGRTSPPPVLISGANLLPALAADVTDQQMMLANAFWPGALTLVMHAQPQLAWDLGDTGGTVALRVPNEPKILELLKETGPLAVSSANKHRESPAKTAAEAQKMLGDVVAVYLENGEVADDTPSTILDVRALGNEGGEITVLRKGAIDAQLIREMLPKVTIHE